MRENSITEEFFDDINAKDESGKTALIKASETGDIATIIMLLDNPDIDPNR